MLDGPVPPLVVVVSAVGTGGIPAAHVGGRPQRGWPGDLAVMAAIISIAALLELAMGLAAHLHERSGQALVWRYSKRPELPADR